MLQAFARSDDAAFSKPTTRALNASQLPFEIRAPLSAPETSACATPAGGTIRLAHGKPTPRRADPCLLWMLRERECRRSPLGRDFEDTP
jgi:hypothetical protein